MTNFKTLLMLRSFNEQLQKNIEGADDILPLVQLKKVVKKFTEKYEEFDESLEDLRLDHCFKEGNKIVRDEKEPTNGQQKERRLSAKRTKSFLTQKCCCLPISSR